MTRKDQIKKAAEIIAYGCSEELKASLIKDFPEIKESEDERIRKELLEEIEFIIPHDDETDSEGLILPSYHARIDRYKSYLEKQKEQKPVTKDGQQECPYKDLALVKDFFGKYKRKCKLSNKACDSKECKQWNELQAEFKRINEAFENGKNEVINRPEVFGLQKPAEWSAEDEEILDAMIDMVSNSLYEPLCPREGMLAWLKSIRPQPHWKPSEEQMEWLESAVKLSTNKPHIHGIIISLYEQLKRL